MATVTQWTLPLNPPNPYPFYLQFLTGLLKNRLWYTKYVVGVVGELDVRRPLDNVREWIVPRTLTGRAASVSPQGITLDDGGGVWFAVQSADRIMRLDPRTGAFRSYGRAGLPFRSPRHLMFAARNVLWYTGAGTRGALVGNLNVGTSVATYWDLPIELLTPEGLWVERGGEAVWLTPINPNTYLTGALLARLVPATGQLTMWTLPGVRPVCAGVAGDRTSIWFTYDGRSVGRAGSVYRLEVSSGRVFAYATPTGVPRRVVLDRTGGAWISDWSGRVRHVAPGADCGTVDFELTETEVDPLTVRVPVRKASAKPKLHSVTPVVTPVVPGKEPCYEVFPLPYPLMSHGIELFERTAGAPEIYFTHGSGITIGKLDP